MTIGEKIYKIRNEMGLTQKTFADKVGVSQSAINYWENGNRNPRIEQLQKMAENLKLPLSVFLDDDYFDILTDEEPGSAEREVAFMEKKVSELTEIMNNEAMSSSQKQQLLYEYITQAEIMKNAHSENVRSSSMFIFQMCCDKLNDEGISKVLDFMVMLTEIPKYLKGYTPTEE